MWTIPNVITLIRVILIPVFVCVYFLDWRWAHEAGAFIFWFAAITDWFDGYLARKLEQSTPFGAFLDPVADKLMVAVALVLLVQQDPSLLLALAAAIIIGREITVSALREWMAEVGARSKVAVSVLGKIKTIAQLLAIGFLIFKNSVFGLPVYQIGLVLLYIAAFLTIISMFQYLLAAWPKLKE